MLQISLFEQYKITKPIRLIELFAGIGSQAKALANLGANFEHYRVCEFDKHAIRSYNAIHNTHFETSDISQLKGEDLGITEKDKYEYILTYSYPCQDLSVAGKGQGMAKNSGTRSGLLWEVERLLNETKELPQVLLMENVKQVIGKKHIKDFEQWIDFLYKKGYTSFWKVLTATDFDIPQSRERCFMVSILCKDRDFIFPKGKMTEKTIDDFIDDEVDEKFYLSERMIEFFNKNSLEQERKGNGFRFEPTDGKTIAKTITTRAGSRMDDNFIIKPKLKQVGTLDIKGNDSIKRVYSPKGLSPTLTTMQGGNQQPKILVKKNLKEQLCDDLINSNLLKENDIINHSYTNSSKKENSRLELKDYIESQNGIMPTLHTRPDTFGVVVCKKIKPSIAKVFEENKESIVKCSKNIWSINTNSGFNDTKVGINHTPTLRAGNSHTCILDKSNYAIRKLTPRECWRLMGFTDTDFEKAEKVNSNAQLYKQAGNSIVVPVLEAIFRNLF